MSKVQNIMNRLVTNLMILVCALSILVTPVQTVFAASFEDTFRYFGESLQDWETITKIARVSSPSYLAAEDQVLTVNYHKDEESTPVKIKVTSGHISVAQELVEAFVDESLWNDFRNAVTAEGLHLVKVDYTSKKVSANKAAGCSSADYAQLKSDFSEISGGTAANDFVFSVLGENIKPESNEVTDAFLGKVFNVSNTIIYIGISVLSIYFSITVIADLLFLMAPAFRRFLISVDTSDQPWNKMTNGNKTKMLVGGFVSETALKSLGCERDSKKAIGLTDARNAGVELMSPDWVYFLTHKVITWVIIMVFLIVFWSGQLGQLASLVLELVTWIYNTLLNMLRG